VPSETRWRATTYQLEAASCPPARGSEAVPRLLGPLVRAGLVVAAAAGDTAGRSHGHVEALAASAAGPRRRTAGRGPSLRLGCSGRCPTARTAPGRSRSRRIAGRTGHRSPRAVAPAAGRPGCSIAAVAAAAGTRRSAAVVAVGRPLA
jgi:hypothetical protein